MYSLSGELQKMLHLLGRTFYFINLSTNGGSNKQHGSNSIRIFSNHFTPTARAHRQLLTRRMLEEKAVCTRIFAAVDIISPTQPIIVVCSRNNWHLGTQTNPPIGWWFASFGDICGLWKHRWSETRDIPVLTQKPRIIAVR